MRYGAGWPVGSKARHGRAAEAVLRELGDPRVGGGGMKQLRVNLVAVALRPIHYGKKAKRITVAKSAAAAAPTRSSMASPTLFWRVLKRATAEYETSTR